MSDERDRQRIRPSPRPVRQGRPGPHRRGRAALRDPRHLTRGVHRPPVLPPRRAAHGRRWQRPAGAGTRPGDPPADRPAAGTAPVRAGPVPRANRPRRRLRAGLRGPPRPHRRHRPTAARRLALPRCRAVLRSDPRQPDGPGEPSPLPLDPWPDRRLLGRGVHRRRARGERGRPRRRVGVHRQPRQQPVGADAGRARHDPGRPGRHHPRGVARRAGRGRRAGHRQDRRGPAPDRIPAVLRPAARSPPWRRARGRTEPTVPELRR